MFFTHNLAIKLMPLAFFFFKNDIAPGFKFAKAFFKAARDTTIKP